MATVMPTDSYPKVYSVNGRDYTMHDAGEDTSFQAGPLYFASIPVATYPKVLTLGGHKIKVRSSAEEASARAAYGQG